MNGFITKFFIRTFLHDVISRIPQVIRFDVVRDTAFVAQGDVRMARFYMPFVLDVVLNPYRYVKPPKCLKQLFREKNITIVKFVTTSRRNLIVKIGF